MLVFVCSSVSVPRGIITIATFVKYLMIRQELSQTLFTFYSSTQSNEVMVSPLSQSRTLRHGKVK